MSVAMVILHSDKELNRALWLPMPLFKINLPAFTLETALAQGCIGFMSIVLHSAQILKRALLKSVTGSIWRDLKTPGGWSGKCRMSSCWHGTMLSKYVLHLIGGRHMTTRLHRRESHRGMSRLMRGEKKSFCSKGGNRIWERRLTDCCTWLNISVYFGIIGPVFRQMSRPSPKVVTRQSWIQRWPVGVWDVFCVFVSSYDAPTPAGHSVVNTTINFSPRALCGFLGLIRCSMKYSTFMEVDINMK